MEFDWSLGALADGLRCYKNEEYFEAHEHWESVWRKCQEPEKSFLQALIQVAAAFHHLRRDNVRGATSMLKSALRRLQPYPEIFESVEVDSLRGEIEAWLKWFDGADASIRPALPKILPNGSEHNHDE